MSWMQDLYRTYEACAEAVGVSVDGQETMLLPVAHTLKTSHVVVHLRSDGTFYKAEESKVDICTPCTDESEARTSGAKKAPHPLFDQVKHLNGELYLKNLLRWQKHLEHSSKHNIACLMISGVCAYMKGGSLNSDLKTCQIEPTDKLFVRFCVSVDGQREDRLWLMPELWEAWTSYYISDDVKQRRTRDICYTSGNENEIYTDKHPKSINRASGNAKLITGNDSSNFTYRGRFTDSHQAATIGYEASQKAHQALRWLISTRGFRCGSQAIVAWAVDKAPVVQSYYEDSCGIYDLAVESDSDKLIAAQNQTFIDYANLLNTALYSSGNADKLQVHARAIVVLALDAPTTGRMSITYYRRLRENEYLERVVNWHNTCKWYQPVGRDKKVPTKSGYFVGAPSFDRICDAVLGKRRGASDDAYDKQKRAMRERLLHCVFDGERIPADMVHAAVRRASSPLALENHDAQSTIERWRDWEQVLGATCAMVKRYCYDYESEVFAVALEGQRTDREYLYGRLLAVADKIESAARYKQGSAKDDVRPTNAIRYMTAFSQHPFRTWHMLFTQQLNPYIQQLHGASWHLNQIEEIMALFTQGAYESDSPLNGKYLLGFFAQRQALRTRTTETVKDIKDINGGEVNELNP